MWFRNEPPKAPWKKWSHRVPCLRVLEQRQLRRRVVAHRQALGVLDVGELIHLAVIDLGLLLVEAMHQIGDGHARRHELRDVERLIGQVRREAGIGQLHRRVERRRQHRVRLPGGRIELRHRIVGRAQPAHRLLDAFGAGILAVEVVEAVVLEIDDDEVSDFGRARRRRRVIGVLATSGGERRDEHNESEHILHGPTSNAALVTGVRPNGKVKCAVAISH